jgi:hypothetical protein
MPNAGILLDYNGPVDLKIIEILLQKLKKTSEFAGLNITTQKRTYALTVECLENISKHSVLKSSNDRRMQPHISIREENEKLFIITGNPIPVEAKEKLKSLLDRLNGLDETALKSLYENILTREAKKGENGAGLGFIFMALKSGNRFTYGFNPLADGYLYFEIQISLNKYIMRKLILEQTSSSPKVILDPEKNVFQISGESRPPDVREFYDQIISWLDEFSLYLINSDSQRAPITFNFNFEYFNSSSGKLILDICKILAGLRTKGINIIVKWHFEKEDTEMLEVGKEMSRIVMFPFEFIESDKN